MRVAKEIFERPNRPCQDDEERADRTGFPDAMQASGRLGKRGLEISTGAAHDCAIERKGKAGYFACNGFFISRNQASALPGRTRASLLKKSSADTRSSPEVQPS
jgi:hypothetical protein